MRLTLLSSTILLSISLAAAADYAALHDTLLDFYSFQRAGTSGSNPHNPFYTRTPYPHASDAYGGSPLDGGWYDAGDFVKFGLNLGFTTYCLLKGYDVFPGAYDDRDSWSHSGTPDGIPDILGQVKVATDYLLKAVVNENTVVRDVGEGNSDHQVWASGYDHHQSRQVFLAEGADIPGMYAASLALMSVLYKPHDATYAASCLSKARQAFTYCTSHQQLSNAQNDYGGAAFYETDTWKDKMACGAVELYRATGEQTYLSWAKDLMLGVGQHYDAVNFGNVGDFAAFELYRMGETAYSSAWFADVEQALRRVVDAPGKLVHGAFVNTNWGVCAGAGNAAFSAALAYMVTGKNPYRDFAFQQINWIAGFSPYSKSYVVRYNGGPTNPHHRNDDNIGSVNLVGGIVSGPTAEVWGGFDPTNAANYNWTFTDAVEIYKNTEVAVNYNAGAIGAVAFIRYYNNPPAGLVRIEEAVTCTPDLIDFNSANAAITARLERSINWKIVITGRTSGATRTVTGTGSTISFTWNGDADNGSAAFVSDEVVDIVLDVPNIAEYHQGRAVAVASISSMKDADFLATDVLVDDFNDGNLVNAFNGSWVAFSDQSEGVSGGASSPPAIYNTTSGKDGTKGILFRLTAADGAAHPYAGVKTCFNADCNPVSIGDARSIVLDILPSVDSVAFRIELEQPSVTDGAHAGVDVRLYGTNWQRVRVPLSGFAAPAWAGGAHGLNPGNVSALRITQHGEGSVRLTIDNVHIDGLSIGSAPVACATNRNAARHGSAVAVQGHVLTYAVPFDCPGSSICELRDVSGRLIRSRLLRGVSRGYQVRMSVSSMPAGMYLLVHRTQDGSAATGMRVLYAGR